MNDKISTLCRDKAIPFVLGIFVGIKIPKSNTRLPVVIATKLLEKGVSTPPTSEELNTLLETAENFDIEIERKKTIVEGLAWLGVEQDKTVMEMSQFALDRCSPKWAPQAGNSPSQQNVASTEGGIQSESNVWDEFFLEILADVSRSDDHLSLTENIFASVTSSLGNKKISKPDLDFFLAFSLGFTVAQTEDLTHDDRKEIEDWIRKMFFIRLFFSLINNKII